jgi:hypothetical protein
MGVKTLSCESCKFWGEEANIKNLGHCHRYAPRSTLRSPLAGTESLDTVWPRLRSDDWCGEWEPKIEADE